MFLCCSPPLNVTTAKTVENTTLSFFRFLGPRTLSNFFTTYRPDQIFPYFCHRRANASFPTTKLSVCCSIIITTMCFCCLMCYSIVHFLYECATSVVSFTVQNKTADGLLMNLFHASSRSRASQWKPDDGTSVLAMKWGRDCYSTIFVVGCMVCLTHIIEGFNRRIDSDVEIG